MSIVVVGAGLAGLTCARLLHQSGYPVQVLEASDGVGGRVRSDRVEGFVLDRGFQVLFDAYPAVRRNLDLHALRLRAFDSGAVICRAGRRSILTDPTRDRNTHHLLHAVTTDEVSFADKLRTLRMILALGWSGRDPQRFDDLSTLAYLRRQGFSEQAIDRFFRPFYGGIFLERELETNAAVFAFYFQMLAQGQTVVPAAGMGAITAQLSAPLLAAGVVRLNSEVAALVREGERVTGVRLNGGDTITADVVVLATDGPSALSLAQIPVPEGARQTVEVYFAGLLPVYPGKKILLNAEADAFVNNAEQLSAVAPEYAPRNRHLLAASIIGIPGLSDREIVVRAMADLRRMWAGDPAAQAALDTYYPLRVYRIPYAQFAQPAGVGRRLPGNLPTTVEGEEIPGLFCAGEWTASSSINGAMESGERCAALVTTKGTPRP